MNKQANCLQQFFTAACVALGLLLATGVYAQDNMKSAEERAKALTEKMKTTLPLEEGQYQKVYDVNLKYAQKTQAIAKSGSGKMGKLKALKASQKEKNKEMKTILNAGQYKKYEEMQAEMKEEAKERWKARKD